MGETREGVSLFKEILKHYMRSIELVLKHIQSIDTYSR